MMIAISLAWPKWTDQIPFWEVWQGGLWKRSMFAFLTSVFFSGEERTRLFPKGLSKVKIALRRGSIWRDGIKIWFFWPRYLFLDFCCNKRKIILPNGPLSTVLKSNAIGSRKPRESLPEAEKKQCQEWFQSYGFQLLWTKLFLYTNLSYIKFEPLLKA